MDDLAGRQHGLERQHITFCRAVFERARPPGALGDVAANGRLPQPGRIGRIEQSDMLNGILEVAGDDIRLDASEEIHLIDLENPVHPFERHHNAASYGDGATCVTRAAASYDDRNAFIVAERGELSDLLSRGRKHDEIGRRTLPRAIGAVGVERGCVLKKKRAADDAGDPWK